MIPERVAIRNFLTYGAAPDGGPAVFDFAGERLWSIAGDNGAGKSAVFDAIRYCLFGEHRGGKQGDGRLVRQGERSAEVEFDFTMAGTLYRIRRTITLSRTRAGTIKETKALGAARFDDKEGAFIPVPDTELVTGLEAWVRNLGLRPDVFNATVLLQQGGADRILTEAPKKRFEIFASIVDLAPYERLATAAGSRRRDADGEAKVLRGTLERIPEVSDGDLAAAEADFVLATDDLETAQTTAAEASARYAAAQQAAELSSALDTLTRRREALDDLLADAERIETRFARYQLITAALPALLAADAALTTAEEADAQAADAGARLEQVDRTALVATRDAAADALATTTDKHRQLLAELDSLNQALPIARILVDAQAEYTRRKRLAAEAGTLESHEAELSRLDTAANSLRSQRAGAQTDQEDARGQRATAAAQASQLADALAARRQAGDEATCSRCGQQVDAAHLAVEIDHLTAAHAAAQAAATDAAATEAARVDDVARLDTALADLDTTRQRIALARERAVAAATERDSAAARLTTAEAAAAALPVPWPARLAADAHATVAAEAARAETLRAAAVDADAEGATRRAAWTAAASALEDAGRLAADLTSEIRSRSEAAAAQRREADVRLEAVDPALAETLRLRRADTLTELAGEVDRLTNAPAAHEALNSARNEKSRLDAEETALSKALNTIPAAHRIPVHVAAAAVANANAARDKAQLRRDDTYQALFELTTARTARAKATERLTAAETNGRVASRLEGLLGRSGLQAALLRQAVDGVEALANDTLTRLSGGNLSVALRVGEDRDGSKLEVLVSDAASADEPLEASFVSGSQKFRVAVAVAAGLGQYLVGVDAVRSLIIDEGFGSLDEAGREVMIGELRNLSEHLERVIVVSHHADFSDPARFPNTFRLRKVGRHTEVIRRV